jgi:acetyl-CoA acetyltransferase family protein
MRESYLIDAARTPRGRMSRPKKNLVGEFANIHPVTLSATLVNAVLKRNASIPAEKIEELIFACANPEREQGANFGRMVVLASDLPAKSSGIQINRACSGALQAMAFANASIRVGDYDMMMAGGCEHMNMLPISGTTDPAHLPFTAEIFGKYPIGTQGTAAELMCEKYKLSQLEMDEFSVRSHQLAHAATQAGKFKNEIIPIAYKDQNGEEKILDFDSNIMPDTSVEKMAKLPKPFKPDGMVHAGNSSAIVDGAGVTLWASEDSCKEFGLKPKARLLASTNWGVNPDIMLDGVIPGTELALKRAGLTLKDIDLFEINEAFACVPVAWMKTLGIPLEKVNINGGAIAMGHPLGGTGAILTATLLNEMERQGLRYGLITMCAAYGQSGTLILENLRR